MYYNFHRHLRAQKSIQSEQATYSFGKIFSGHAVPRKSLKFLPLGYSPRCEARLNRKFILNLHCLSMRYRSKK